MEMGEQQYGLPVMNYYGMVMMGGGDGDGGGHDTINEVHVMGAGGPAVIGSMPMLMQEAQMRMDPFDGCFDGEGGGANGHAQGRWLRQETLTLLEIRTRLDHKFKETPHKAPIWDEVSRIMAEEYGYQRTGKKCREKLDNLCKYYKKTRDQARSGKQGGKHYRFFRQLEELYGASTSNNINSSDQAIIKSCNPILHITNNEQLDHDNNFHQEHYMSFSNSSDFLTTSSSEEGEEGEEDHLCPMGLARDHVERKEDDLGRNLKRGKKGYWRSKVMEFVNLQLRKLMEMQEAWLERMLNVLDHKEQERASREEEWRCQEVARLDRESKNWTRERAWNEARNSALIKAMERISNGGRLMKPSMMEDESSMDAVGVTNVNNNVNGHDELNSRRWPESEIIGLIKLRTSMEARFREGGCPKMALWEEISAGMSAKGYERSAKKCKEKWENINKYFRKTKECKKKRRENSKTCPYYKHLESLYNQRQLDGGDHHEPSPSSSNVGTMMSESRFHLLTNEGDHQSLWKSQTNHIG